MLRASLLLSALLAPAPTAAADDYKYDGQKTVAGETFTGAACAIQVGGKSSVSGIYSVKDGTLEVTLDGSSTLTVTGAARRVVVRQANGQSTVDLRGLKVGAGGVEVADLNGKSRLLVGSCAGEIAVTSADGGCEVRYKAGTKVVGRDNLKGGSKLVPEK